MIPPTAIGANVAVIKDHQILLTKREDFEVWCLPGGSTDPGESLVETALREAREETGLMVELTGLVGVHSRLGGDGYIHVTIFSAHPIGGALNPQADEVIDIGYFDAGSLPPNMMPWHLQPALDALAGVTGAAYTTRVNTPFTVGSRRELYELRDQSGKSRLDFFRSAFEEEGSLVMQRDL